MYIYIYLFVFVGLYLEDEDGDSEMIFYVLLRGVDRFYEEYNRYLGGDNDQVESDVQLFKVCIKLFFFDVLFCFFGLVNSGYK